MQAAVQQLLTAHGFYSPLELLLTTNRLGYDDYQAWRRGEHSTLDALYPDGVRSAQTLVEEADYWARSLGLEPGMVPLLGTDIHAGEDLRASTDPRLDGLLGTEYRRDVDQEQPDLFLDGAQMEAQNALIDVLRTRDLGNAEARLRDLTELDADHWSIVHAAVLVESLGATAPTNPEEAAERLETLEQSWLPAAAALLRAAARDFLTPQWRNIGQALESAPFDPEQPRRHASWAYLNGLDWDRLKRTVLTVPDWESIPILKVRLGEAEWRLRDRRSARELWFDLCWHAPEHFAECIETASFPDTALKRAWDTARDQDIDPPLTLPWLPAWVLIDEPGIARGSAPCGGDTGPERAFDHLLALRAVHTDREHLNRRRALKDLHPGLLGRYLDALDG